MKIRILAIILIAAFALPVISGCSQKKSAALKNPTIGSSDQVLENTAPDTTTTEPASESTTNALTTDALTTEPATELTTEPTIDEPTTEADTTDSATTPESTTRRPTQPQTTTARSTPVPTTPEPTIQLPTQAPTTTQRSTQSPTTTKRSTQAPTTTQRSTQAPTTTKRPTQPATTTQRPTQAPTQDPSKPTTNSPNVTVSKYTSRTSYILGGKCEIGATVKVTGGTQTISTGSDNGDFLVEVFFTEATTLTLTAQTAGKEPSGAFNVEVAPNSKAKNLFDKYDGMGVIVGYNYTNYFADCLPGFLGEDVLNSDEISDLTERTKDKLRDLKDEGCNAELIYVVAPNTMMLWPENVPSRYTQYKGKTLYQQWKDAVTAGGATVIDLYDVMLSHKNDEFKIYQKTDSHWTEYGAYLAYVEMMNHIAKKFPDAAPRPRSNFEFYNKEMNFGDIYPRLELDVSALKETTVFANFKFDPPHFNPKYDKGHLGMDLYKPGTLDINHDNVSFGHTTESNASGNLPSAYILRDSYEGALHAFYTDRFSTATFQGMWGYGWFDTGSIVRVDPDYIICVVGERNMKGILYH